MAEQNRNQQQGNDGYFEKSGWQPGRQDQQQGQHRGKGPKGYTRSDDRIREDIYHRLTEDHDVDASEIEVEVRNAEVTLMGTVNDRDAKRRAEDLIENVSGVQHVQNNLRVQQQSSSPSQSLNRQELDRRSGGTSGLLNDEVM